MDEVLTVKDVADLLKLNQQTVRNWIDQGSLPAVRVGRRRVRIKRSDLDQFIEQGYRRGRSSNAQRTRCPHPELAASRPVGARRATGLARAHNCR